MRKLLCLILIVLWVSKICPAQTPVWSWARNATSFGGSMEVKGLQTDSAGNSYSMGYAYAGIQFGSLPRLQRGMFLVKHDPQGNQIWSFQADCQPVAFATDSVGNSYITGSFQDTLQLGVKMLVCQGKKDIFVAKINNAGNVIWANRAGGIGNPGAPPMPPVLEDDVYSLAIDAAGNCYLGGIVMASNNAAAMFGHIPVFPPAPTSIPTRFNVLAKYNAAGQIQWVNTINNTSLISRDLAVNKQGQIYSIGIFNGTINFGGTSLSSMGQEDVCVGSFDANGNVNWVKQFGGSGLDLGDAIVVDKQGNLIFTGVFADTVNFGSSTLIKPASPTGTNTLFIAKLNSSGNVLWANQATGTGSAGDSKITLDTAGNSYVISAFSNTVIIGSQTFISSGVFQDILISKWNSAGTPVWAVAAQGLGNDYSGGVALDPATSGYYVAGTFEQNLNFGNNNLQAGQSTNFFLAKLSNIVNGLPAMVSDADFTVFPNPAVQHFSIKFTNGVARKSGKLQLYSTTGKQVREIGFSNQTELIIDRKGMAPGLYFYKLLIENKVTKTGKIIFN